MLRAALSSLMLLLCTCTSAYTVSEAMDALYYCKAAYCPWADIAAWNCTECGYHSTFTDVNVFYHAAYDGQAFTGYNPSTNMIVVAFRGSSNIPNWIADLKFAFTTYPNTACSGCEVHRGFFQVYQSLKTEIVGAAQALVSKYNSASLLVTGHSLGAALSVLAIVDIAQSCDPGSGFLWYDFGCPRVGNPAFVEWATQVVPGAQGFRNTHARDPVPHVPPLDFGFLHIPQEIWFPGSGDSNFIQCQDNATSEDPKCSDSVIPYGIEDHLSYLGLYTGCGSSDDSLTSLSKQVKKHHGRKP